MFFMTGMLHANSSPVASRVYGNQYTAQVADSQLAGTVGVLDTTFDGDGSLVVTNSMTNPQAMGIQTLSDGTFLVVLSPSSGNIQVAKYNAQGTLQTYGTAGLANLGSVATYPTPRATMIDAQGRLLVGGGSTSGTSGWIKRVSTDGTSVSTFTTGTNWRSVGGLGQQSSGKIIAVGWNNTPYAQIARYNLDGTIDTTFGAFGTGYVQFDGTHSLPNSPHGLYSVVIDSSNNIYVLMLNSSGSGAAYMVKLDSTGAWVGTYSGSGSELTNLSASTEGQFFAAMNNDGNIVLAGAKSGAINVTALTTSGANVGGFTNFSSSSISGYAGHIFTLLGLVTDSNNNIYCVGSDTTAGKNMAVIRVVGSTGALDTTFNPSLGYNFFNISNPTTTSQIQAAALAHDGQLYTAGYQVNSGTTIPYVSRLYNNQYVTQVAQFPNSQEQGNQDYSFGTASSEVYAGVTTPFNGSFAQLLQQKAKSVVELSTGKMIVGMDGYTNSSGTSTMMFARLSAAGALDTTYGTSGYVTTTNVTSAAETLNVIVVDTSDNLYVAGTSAAATTSGGATLRKYNSSGVQQWATVDGSNGAQGVGVALQGTTRALLLENIDGTHGRISGYTLAGSAGAGVLDTTFGPYVTGSSGPQTGQILYNSYSLNMGPVYSAVINTANIIYIAYKNSLTNKVSVAAIQANGTGLFTNFASSGIYADLFGITTPDVNNIRIGIDRYGQLVIAAVTGSTVYIVGVNPDTGALDANFNNGSILSFTVTGANSLQLARLTGISDGTTLLTMWDDASDDSILVARITADGTGLDTTFDSQGSQAGVLSLQIGNEVNNYAARTATSAMIQSTTGAGANKGNIVLAAFEQVTSSDATPMVMRVFGTLGTTEVKNFPLVVPVPGTFDRASDFTTGSVTSTGLGNVIFVYPNDSVYLGLMLIGVDNGTTSKVSRVYTDTLALDTTFGTSGTYTIPGSLAGISCIAIDSNNKVLVGGTTPGLIGWAKRLTADGAIDVSFTMPSSAGTITAINGVAQQKSGRYIFAGQNTISGTNYPVLIGFKDLGSPLVVDPTFNPLLVGGTGSSQYGIFGLGSTITSPITTTAAYTLAIASDDTIVTAYRNGIASFTTYVAQVTANGSGYVRAFNSGAPLDTTIVTDGSNRVRVAIDSTGKFVVAASRNSGSTHQVQLARYTTAGVIDSGFNSGAIKTVSNLGSANVNLTGLMESSTQQTVFTGYNTAGGNGRIFAARLASNGSLDSTWNPSPTSPDTAGVLTFNSGTTPAAVNALSAYIQYDGVVDILGSSSSTTSGDVIFMQVYGDDGAYQVVQSQVQQAAGILDTTLPSGSTGSMILDGTVYVEGSVHSATIPGVPQKIAIYNTTTTGSAAPYIQANGSVMIASSNGSNSYLTMLNPDLSANTNYGSSGTVNLGIKDDLTDMYLTGNISSNVALPVFVTGRDAGVMWAATIAGDSSGGAVFVDSNALTYGYAVRQATNGRILVAGYTGTSGAIVGFESITSGGTYPIDETFGNQGITATYPTGSSTSLPDGGGYYLTSVNSPIMDMVVDSLDRMYIAYYLTTSSGVTVNVQRLLCDGTGVDAAFGTRTITGTGFSASTPIRIALDATNNLVYVAAQDGAVATNRICLQRFSTVDGTPATQLNSITISGKALTLSDLFIDAQGYSYVMATNTTDNKSVVARVTSAFALDTTGYAVAGGTPGIANMSAGSITSIKAGALDPDRRTYVVGTDVSNHAYLTRVFGDTYTSQVSEAIALGTAGTIDPTFGSSTPTAGYYNLTTLSGVVSSGTGKAMLSLENGSNYIAIDNGTNTQLIRNISSGALDTTFGGGDGIAVLAPTGVQSMLLDGSGRLVLVGTTGGAGWVQRYQNGNSGNKDTTFGSSGVVTSGIAATVAIEQTLARLVVAGAKSGGHGALFAYTSIDPNSGTTGVIDTTFNPHGVTPGVFDTGISNTINALIADDFDRLIFAQLNSDANAVLLYRLTSGGQLDTTFGTAGVVTLDDFDFGSAPDDNTQIRIAFNADGDIVVAAHLQDGDIGVLTCDNGTINASGANGGVVDTVDYVSATILGYSPTLSALATSLDDYIYVMGNQTSGNPMWIARFYTTAGAVTLDDTGFNPNAVAPGAPGIFEYAPGTASVHNYYGLAVRNDARIEAIGAETISAVVTPMMIRVYSMDYTSQETQSPNSKPTGTSDETFGLSGSTGFTYYGVASGTANMAQVGKAVALQDDDNIVVAIDGGVTNGGLRQIMIDKFNIDGTLNTSFNTTGRATVTTPYFAIGANQYVQDMVTFTTTAGVHKAILAGYATASSPSVSNSLLMQYNLDTAALDTANFGGLNGNPSGIAFGDCKQINAIGQQSSGRIVVSGISQDNKGVLLGYSSKGKLDSSFGYGSGYRSVTAAPGLYTHAIDTLNRIVTAYNNSGTVALVRFLEDGSATDGTSFTTTTMTGVTANDQIKVSIDSSNNLYVAAVVASGNSIMINSYDGVTGGAATHSVTKTGTQLGNASAVYSIARLMVDETGNVVVVGYDSNAKVILIARFTSSLVLDTTFGGGAGYLTYQIAGGVSSQVATDAMIHPDGRIIIVGSEN